MARSSHRGVGIFADVITRGRYVVLVGWVVATALLLFVAPSEPDAEVGGLQDVIPAEIPAIQGQITAFEEFGIPLLARQAVVQRDEDGLSPLAHAQAVWTAARTTLEGGGSGMEHIAGAIPITNVGGVFPSSSESGTTTLTYLFFAPDVVQGVRVIESERYADQLSGGDAYLGVTGAVAAGEAQSEILDDWLVPLQIVSIGAIVLVVAVALRSILAPLLALVCAALGFLVSARLGVQVGNIFDLAQPTALQPIVIVLLVGVVTDYFIIVAMAMRTEIEAGAQPVRAVAAALDRVGGAIAMAALTTAGGTLALLVARFELYSTLGPQLAVAVLSGALVAATFAPAALAVLGGRAVPPRSTRRPGVDRGPRPVVRVRRWLLDLVTNRPVAVLMSVTAVVVLGAVVVTSPEVRLGANLLSELPADSEPRVAAAEAGEGFSPGIVAPTQLLVTGTDLGTRLADLADVEQRLREVPGVAGVLGPGEQSSPWALGLVRAPSGDAVRYLVVFDDSPYSAEAIATLSDVEEVAAQALDDRGIDTEVTGVGDTAIAAALVELTQNDLLRIAVAMAVIDLLVLVLFLRCLVAPLLILAAGATVVLVAVAIVGTVAPRLWGADSFTFFVPIAVLVLLLGFVTDYHVLLIQNVWARTENRDLSGAIVAAEQDVAAVVISAGVALAASFAALIVVPLVSFRQLGVAIVVGVLLDITLLRLFVVPSGLAALGRWTAWPNRGLMRRFDATRHPTSWDPVEGDEPIPLVVDGAPPPGRPAGVAGRDPE